ncbi:MAG: methionine ABC transporter substrate-binding protein [Campylobacteraceae bacterium]|jgi:D-methionine transport system substrate-binding protein|nr:methionine ABC transporter substrate-binding protein [Campylobacteraceae bacterium]
MTKLKVGALFSALLLLVASADAQKIVVGGSPGPYIDLFKQAIAPALEKKGYTFEYKEFSDYVQPNLALNNKAIDVNIFQHSVYLAKFSADKGLSLSPLISVPTAALGLYSKKYKSVAEIKDGSVVTIPNDATNLARALRYLQTVGLITIKPDIDAAKASEKDIAQNPKKLKFKPVEAAGIPRTVDSVDLAVANGNYAISAGIYAGAIDRETLSEDYINVIAVRTEDFDKQFVKDIKASVESEEFRKVIDDKSKIYKDFQKPQWLLNKTK